MAFQQNQQKRERVSMLPPSARPEGQLTPSQWPGSFCPPPPAALSSPILPHFRSECKDRQGGPRSLEEFPSVIHVVCCTGAACFTHERLTISAQRSSLCLSAAHRVLDFNPPPLFPPSPPPASLSFTVPVLCTKNENSYRESFCLHGGNTSRQIPLRSLSSGFASRHVHFKNKNRIDSTMRTNTVLCSSLDLPLLFVALFTHSHSRI